MIPNSLCERIPATSKFLSKKCAEMTKPKLLSDDQVRSFIVDGFISLEADIEPRLNEEIYALLKYSSENETPLGNNILSRIPRMHEVLRCPKVKGALISLLGPDYFIHPHRAMHKTTPVSEGTRPVHKTKPITEDTDKFGLLTDAHLMGEGSTATSVWHQDSQSPLARARHHVPRYLIGFYFPHAVSKDMGPTRIQVGSYMHSRVSELRNIYQPETVDAGTFFLLHFDMVHAGFPNFGDTDRYMMKFVFTRTYDPRKPTWDNKDSNWYKPSSTLNDDDLSSAWRFIWNWLLGARSPDGGALAVSPLGKMHGECEENNRIRAIYADSDVDESKTLVESLLNKRGSQKHERVLMKDERGSEVLHDDTSDKSIRWNEQAVVMEDETYRIITMGRYAIKPLMKLVEIDDPWLQINTSFALGELGCASKEVVSYLTKLLASPHHEVVRQALDALAPMASHLDEDCFLEIQRLILEVNDEWQQSLVLRGWTGQDQVRMNAALVLLSAATRGNQDPGIEKSLTALLSDPNGYAAAIAAEALIRLSSASALSTAVKFLSDRRWDDTLLGTIKKY